MPINSISLALAILAMADIPESSKVKQHAMKVVENELEGALPKEKAVAVMETQQVYSDTKETPAMDLTCDGAACAVKAPKEERKQSFYVSVQATSGSGERHSTSKSGFENYALAAAYTAKTVSAYVSAGGTITSIHIEG